MLAPSRTKPSAPARRRRKEITAPRPQAARARPTTLPSPAPCLRQVHEVRVARLEAAHVGAPQVIGVEPPDPHRGAVVDEMLHHTLERGQLLLGLDVAERLLDRRVVFGEEVLAPGVLGAVLVEGIEDQIVLDRGLHRGMRERGPVAVLRIAVHRDEVGLPDVHLDADLGEVGLQHDRRLARLDIGARHRDRRLEGEAVRHAGLLEMPLRLLGIVVELLRERRVVPVLAGCRGQRRGRDQAVVDVLADVLAVDGAGERLAQMHVVEGRLGAIERAVEDAGRRPRSTLEARRLAHRHEVLGRAVRDDVDRAGAQIGELRRRIGNAQQLDRADARLRPVVVGVGFELGRHVGLEALRDERARARHAAAAIEILAGRAFVRDVRALAHDRGLVAHQLQPAREGPLELDAHDMRLGCGDLLDEAAEILPAPRGGEVLLPRVHDVLGGHPVAVVEAHVGAELERVDHPVLGDGRHLGRGIRHEAAVCCDAHEVRVDEQVGRTRLDVADMPGVDVGQVAQDRGGDRPARRRLRLCGTHRRGAERRAAREHLPSSELVHGHSPPPVMTFNATSPLQG